MSWEPVALILMVGWILGRVHGSIVAQRKWRVLKQFHCMEQLQYGKQIAKSARVPYTWIYVLLNQLENEGYVHSIEDRSASYGGLYRRMYRLKTWRDA